MSSFSSNMDAILLGEMFCKSEKDSEQVLTSSIILYQIVSYPLYLVFINVMFALFCYIILYNIMLHENIIYCHMRLYCIALSHFIFLISFHIVVCYVTLFHGILFCIFH